MRSNKREKIDRFYVELSLILQKVFLKKKRKRFSFLYYINEIIEVKKLNLHEKES